MDLLKFFKNLRRKSQYLYRSGWSLSESLSSSTTAYIAIPEGVAEMSSEQKRGTDNRLEKRPVEVYKEIISEVPKINLNLIDKQIAMVRKRINLLEDLGVQLTDEIEAIKFLEARKKLLKKRVEFRWPIATFQKVDELCKKYKLRMVDFPPYYKNIPMEGIDEMEKFLREYRQIRSDQPVIKLIIDEAGKETRKDPIILASSPFGKWFYVLGAWDKEVEIIDDLIYKGK